MKMQSAFNRPEFRCVLAKNKTNAEKFLIGLMLKSYCTIICTLLRPIKTQFMTNARANFSDKLK